MDGWIKCMGIPFLTDLDNLVKCPLAAWDNWQKSVVVVPSDPEVSLLGHRKHFRPPWNGGHGRIQLVEPIGIGEERSHGQDHTIHTLTHEAGVRLDTKGTTLSREGMTITIKCNLKLFDLKVGQTNHSLRDSSC